MANAKRPRTGQRRQVNQPLKIDRLPLEVRNAIQTLKDGHTFQEIEELSALPLDKGGFVNWDTLPIDVLELFPRLRLPHTNLHRWIDLRVRQVMAETMGRSAQARELAAAFAGSVLKGGDQAVLNAARDQFMSILAEDTTPKGRAFAAKGLIALSEQMQASRTNDIRERKVDVDVRKIKLLEAREQIARDRVDQATQQAAKRGTGQFSIEDLNLLRERTFGLPPLLQPAVSAHD